MSYCKEKFLRDSVFAPLLQLSPFLRTLVIRQYDYVKLHLRHKRTNEQTDKETNGQNARNRIWCILALKCDIWWHYLMIFLTINWPNVVYLRPIGWSRIFIRPLNFYEASRFVPPSPHRMDAPDRHNGQTVVFVFPFVRSCLGGSLTPCAVCRHDAACREIWLTSVDVRFHNGALFQSVTSTRSCLERCVATPNCFAADYNSDTDRCWIHIDASDLEQTISAPGFRQYHLVRRCDAGQWYVYFISR